MVNYFGRKESSRHTPRAVVHGTPHVPATLRNFYAEVIISLHRITPRGTVSIQMGTDRRIPLVGRADVGRYIEESMSVEI
jgi:hypothetical protein